MAFLAIAFLLDQLPLISLNIAPTSSIGAYWMLRIMALLAIAHNRQLTNANELTVDIIEAELKTDILTHKIIESLAKNILDEAFKLDIRIDNMGKRAKVINTRKPEKKEELQIYLFHTQPHY